MWRVPRVTRFLGREITDNSSPPFFLPPASKAPVGAAVVRGTTCVRDENGHIQLLFSILHHRHQPPTIFRRRTREGYPSPKMSSFVAGRDFPAPTHESKVDGARCTKKMLFEQR
jgi:hypothetical protein